MSDLVMPVDKGKIVGNTTDTSKKERKTGNSELGKEEFLQLLVTQMKYQDPLSPTDNTQFVEQLATFSMLEQMQNMNSVLTNNLGYSLVDKEVIMKTTSSSTGKETLVQGVVDYVITKGNKTYLSIDDKLYSMDDLHTVLGNHYVVSQKLPKVEEQSFEYDHQKPEDVTVKVSLGEDEYEASAVVVLLDGNIIANKYLSYEDGKITINKEAFAATDAGEHTLGFVFNDALTTTVTDKVTVKITGHKQMNELPKDDATGSGDDANEGTEGTEGAGATES